ncbi:hypothetical protein [Nocardia mangyaensis]|uniref:hypothetical protein n=1 Tax=Nocardia mangyaensis TaxID=2213200 RepID=UPI002674FDA9|nr:hypothetical protein [Nocardia mangyaensis]MDO3650687.1 hypothetical protein [Nocardia mangyaensis]
MAFSLPLSAANAEQPTPASVATDRQERVLETRDGVIVSHVSYALPLPAGVAAHPAACDRTGYLRYRSADGPADSRAADNVIVQEPGAIGGAVNSDSVAANTVAAARAMGEHIEFWALARRSACLDETLGFDYALRTGNYLDAVDYYFNGKPIEGSAFPGFRQSQDLAVLDAMGMERIIRDQYEMMLFEIPDQAERQQKYVCTGISLGGLVTGFFSDWDFDGNPATTRDAGYNQCAAFAAQDTMITSDPVAIQNTPFLHDITNAIVGPTNDVVKAAANIGALPRSLVSVPIIGSRTFMIYRLAGLAAHLEPDAESQLLAHLPRDPDLEASLNFMFAGSLGSFVTNGADGSGSIRDFRFTNQALLGVFIDNNSGNFPMFHQGVGALAGGPVAEKAFPTPVSVTQVPLLGGFLRISAGSQQRVRPTDRNTLYTWRNYDDVAGVPFTAPNHETSDIRDAARQLGSGAPYAYWETYFPARIFLDIGAGYGGARGGDMTNLRYANMARTKPNYSSFAGDGFVQQGAALVVPPPPTAQVVTLPGYSHVDTIGAARVQNDGKPDASAQTLAEFVRSLP